MQQQRAGDRRGLGELLVDRRAVIADRGVDPELSRRQIGERAAEAEADHGDLAVARLESAQRGDRGADVGDALRHVELAHERHRLLPLGVAIAEIDARLEPPEEIRDQHVEALRREAVGDGAQRVVDAEYLLHDHDTRPASARGRRVIGIEPAAVMGDHGNPFSRHSLRPLI